MSVQILFKCNALAAAKGKSTLGVKSVAAMQQALATKAEKPIGKPGDSTKIFFSLLSWSSSG